MFDHSGNPITEAKLSEAVQIIGWKDLPTAGEVILEVENERKARMVTRYREMEQAKLLTQEHQVAADKKQEQYLIVNSFGYDLMLHCCHVICLVLSDISSGFRSTRSIWRIEERAADILGYHCQFLKMRRTMTCLNSTLL